VSPRLAAVGGAALLAASAAVALWSGLLADGERSALAWLVVLASCAWSLALLASTRWRVPAGFHLAAALAAASVTSAVATSDAGAAAAPVLFVPIVLYVAYFLTARATAGYTAGAAIAFAATAAARDVDAAAARAALLAGVLVATAAVFRVLRDHVFRLIRALDHTSRTDALTGVLNRLGLDERLAEELERAGRTGADCAVLISDLDRFKALNDLHGHHAGDAALRDVASALTSRLRRLDSVGRFGGDEFVVVLPGSSRGAAEAVARELAESVEDSTSGRELGVTMSFGVGVFSEDGTTVDEVLGAADRDLLEVKRGRMPDAQQPEGPG